MKQLLELECAVWHATLPVSDIVDVVRMTPTLCWSSGTINEKTGLTHDRTYCRFELGRFSQKEFSEALSILSPFEALKELKDFDSGRGKITVYVKGNDTFSEVYIDAAGVSAINRLNAMIAFRW